jgi:hypothetical protein
MNPNENVKVIDGKKIKIKVSKNKLLSFFGIYVCLTRILLLSYYLMDVCN